MTKQQIIDHLGLRPHVEGGYFRRTYEADWLLKENNASFGPRRSLTSIYYLLTNDSPVGHLHKNRSDIVHFFHLGKAVRYTIIHPNGKLEQISLGSNLTKGHQLQITVKGGCWKASQLIDGDYGLISEAVTPEFEYHDMEMADLETIQRDFPTLLSEVERFIKF